MEEATAELRRLRTKADVAEGRCEEEILAMKETLVAQVEKGRWSDLFTGANARHTSLILVFYSFQQLTGTHFGGVYMTTSVSYSPSFSSSRSLADRCCSLRFLRKNGYGSKSFVYPIISSSLGAFSVVISMFTAPASRSKSCIFLSSS